MRSVRSYVRREGRITRAQSRALAQLWPTYGVVAQGGLLNFVELFGRKAPVFVEIGFGDGNGLCALARTHPQNNYLGIEVYRPGVGSLLLKLEAAAINNVRVIREDAAHVFAARIPDASLQAIYLFFPDPWPKKRHHKRRLVQTHFVELVATKLKPGGCFHVATDWQDYADHIMAVAAQVPALEKASGAADFAQRPEFHQLTRFERRGQALGHQIWDLVYTCR
ncbi:MAG: tRNA (guanosine(46)-N7)-methyltransferase TrmB [Acidiferrobacterales bacterium]